MDWTAPIDIYCERLGSEYWAEPWNAVSNISFILAAIWGLHVARQRGDLGPVNLLMITLVAMIGVGSYLFHTHANLWSELTDVIPIWSFVALAVLVGTHRIGGVRPGRIAVVAAIVVAIVVVVVAMSEPGSDAGAGGGHSHGHSGGHGHSHTADAPLLNGSLQYAPALIALLVFSLVSWRRQSPFAPWLSGATAVFFVSLCFRTVDIAVCDSLAIGTHFVWHLLNGLMLGLVLQVLIRAGREERSGASERSA